MIATFGTIGPFRIRTDAAGMVQGLSGIGGSLQVTVDRVGPIDLATFGPEFSYNFV